MLFPNTKQTDATRPSANEIIEDLEERVFKDRLPESTQPPAPSQKAETAA